MSIDKHIEIEMIINSTFEKLRNINEFESYVCKKNIFERISEISSVILFLSEADISTHHDSKELTFEYMKLIKQELLSSSSNLHIGLFGGLSNVGISVVAANLKYGGYEKLLLTITNYIVNSTHVMLDDLEKNLTDTKITYFDLISGLSGVSCFLLNRTEFQLAKKCLVRILEYFVKLTGEYTLRQNVVPYYFIKSEHQLTEKDKMIYPDGCINFSLSHGISGILYTLSKAMKLGVVVDDQLSSIERIVRDILAFSYIDVNGCIQFSGRVSLDDYSNRIVDPHNSRASWCYGSPGIASVLHLAGEVLNNHEIERVAYNSILKLCEEPVGDMKLEFPLICHGFAGTLLAIQNMNNKKEDSKLKNMSETLLELLLGFYDVDVYSGYYNSIYTMGINGLVKEEKIDFSLLEGSLGIILTMNSMIKNEPKIWKQMMCLS